MSRNAPRIITIKVPGGQGSDEGGDRPQGEDDQLHPRRTPAPRSPSRTTARSTLVPPMAPSAEGRRARRSTRIANPHIPEVGRSAFLGTVVEDDHVSARSSRWLARQGRPCCTITQIRKLHGGARDRERRRRDQGSATRSQVEIREGGRSRASCRSSLSRSWGTGKRLARTSAAVPARPRRRAIAATRDGHRGDPRRAQSAGEG